MLISGEWRCEENKKLLRVLNAEVILWLVSEPCQCELFLRPLSDSQGPCIANVIRVQALHLPIVKKSWWEDSDEEEEEEEEEEEDDNGRLNRVLG
jgi:hypothetical protein